MTKADFVAGLYLVCHIYRRGKLVFDPNTPISSSSAKPKKGEILYKRPFGCAVMALSGCDLEKKTGVEYTPPADAMFVYTPLVVRAFFLIDKLRWLLSNLKLDVSACLFSSCFVSQFVLLFSWGRMSVGV